MWRALAVGLLFLLHAPAARADATVTLCASDDQAGPGANLTSALAAGGHITFNCGAASVTITVNCTHQITADTEIDGGGTVTLQGHPRTPGCGGNAAQYTMFGNASPQKFSLTLSRLSVTDATPVPDGGVTTLTGGNVARGNLNVTVTGSTIANSYQPIVLQQGQVQADHSAFTGNQSTVIAAPVIAIGSRTQFIDNGGAPLQTLGGTATIVDAEFTGNKRVSDLSNCASIDIQNTRFTGNTSPDAGGALSIGCNTRISNSVFSKNQARSGGAIYIGDTAGETDLVGDDFTANVATAEGGAIALRYEIYAPVPPAQSVELHGVTFTENHAQMGGALEFARGALPGVALNDRTLLATEAQFIDNQADLYGGALVVARAEAVLSRAIFIGNRALKAGGAVVSQQTDGDGSTQIANSLLVKNVAPMGAAFVGQGVDFVNSTLADNDGPAVSGVQRLSPFLLLGGPNSPQPIQFQNTIISGGTGGGCGPPVAAAPLQDAGGNLQYPGNACAASIAVGAPQFGPSYIPLPTSPAAHGGSDAVCAASPVGGRDIWGTVRPNGGHCAIGAAESNIWQMVSRTLGPVLTIASNISDCACRKH